MCFEYDMSHIDSKPRIHRPRADQASQTGGGQTQFLKEGMAADADQRGPGMAIRKLVFEKIMGKLWFLTHFNSPGTFVHFRDTLSFSMRKSTFLYIRLIGPGTVRCKI